MTNPSEHNSLFLLFSLEAACGWIDGAFSGGSVIDVIHRVSCHQQRQRSGTKAAGPLDEPSHNSTKPPEITSPPPPKEGSTHVQNFILHSSSSSFFPCKGGTPLVSSTPDFFAPLWVTPPTRSPPPTSCSQTKSLAPFFCFCAWLTAYSYSSERQVQACIALTHRADRIYDLNSMRRSLM